MKKLTASLLLLVLTTGCGDPVSPRLMAPPEAPPVKEELALGSSSADGLSVRYNPKVDIVFVVDNSRSMENEINIMKKNIGQFVSKLADNNVMDYRIGVTTVYDSIRFIDDVSEVLLENPNTGERNYLEKGELLPLKNSKGELMWKDKRYVTRKNLDQLNSLFDLDVSFVDDNEVDEESGEYIKVAKGPAYEEAFSPLRELILNKDSDVKFANKGFIRQDAHLVIFFLTDAEDSSPDVGAVATKDQHKDGTLDLMPVERLYEDILSVKKDPSKISAFGLLCPASNSYQCRRVSPNDPNSTLAEAPATRIRQFVKLVHTKQNEERLNISENITPFLDLDSQTWGLELAEVGKSIKKRVLEKRIYLGEDNIPAYNRIDNRIEIAVYYGDVMLPEHETKGWTYDRITNSVTIHSGIDPTIISQSDAEITVQYLKIDPQAEFSEEL